MNKPRKLIALLALCLATGFAPAAQTEVQDGIPVKPLSSLRVFASEEKIERQSQLQYLSLLEQAKGKNALATDTNPQLIRLRAIARRIIPFTPRWNPAAAKWDWQVNLLASKQVNAFCMPGGRIAFFNGIITTLKLTDDEVAAIMGHEITHALREHGREQQAKSTGTMLLSRLAGFGLSAYLGVDPRGIDYAAQKGAQLASLKFSRDDEREADLVGLDLAARAGFDPRAGIALWQKMAALNQRQPLALLSTHPGGQERIDQIKANMNLLLPLYARAKGTTVDKLPAYRTVGLN